MYRQLWDRTMLSRAKTNKSLSKVLDDEKKKHDNPEDLKKAKKICVKHSVLEKQLIDYEVILGITLKELKEIFEKEFGTAVAFQCVYIVLTYKGKIHKALRDDENKTLLEYGFNENEFSLEPGKEFYVLCEDKFSIDTHLKAEEA